MIQKNKVVTLKYTLKDEDGEVIDSSTEQEPMAYIHGIGNIIPGLEAALDGKGEGENVQVKLAPTEGFGERDESLLKAVPRQAFPVEDLQPGMQFQAQGEEGPEIITVMQVQDDQVVVDGNHPLAGMSLDFDVTVLGVRDASEEELAHGHVHGPGGHQH